MAETLTIEIKEGAVTSAPGAPSGNRLPEAPGLMQAAWKAASPVMPAWMTQAMNVYQGAMKQMGGASPAPAAPASGGSSLAAAAVGGVAKAATTLAVSAPAAAAPAATVAVAPAAASPAIGAGTAAVAGGAAAAGPGLAAGALAAVGGPVGLAVVAGLGVVAYGLKKVYDAANKLSDRLAPYSPSLAVARAEADVRQTLGDMRRANYLGTDLARFTAAQSQFSQSGQDLLANILKPLVPLVTSILNGLTLITDILNVLVDMIKDVVGFVGEMVMMVPGVQELINGLGELIEWVKKIYREYLRGKGSEADGTLEIWSRFGMPPGFDAVRDTASRLRDAPNLPGSSMPAVGGGGFIFGGS